MTTSAVSEPRRSPVATWVCRWCGSPRGVVVLDLGDQPAADYFPDERAPGPDPVHPLAMIQCERCSLAQLETDPTTPDEPRGVEPLALIDQARLAVSQVAAGAWLPEAGTVLEHPSPHGGSWLPHLAERGLRAVAAGPADVVVDAFGMMHEADQRAAMRARAAELTPGGLLLVQFNSLAGILRQGMWNALRHGHFAYYSAPVLVAMGEELGLHAVGVWEYDLYGGTVMFAFARQGARCAPVDQLIEREIAQGVLDPDEVSRLQESVTDSKTAVRRYVDDGLAAGWRMAGYGAASRAVALLATAGIEHGELLGVADASPTKIGRLIPAVRIAVISPHALVELRPDRVLLFVPDLLDEVRAALPEIELGGGRWTILDPYPVEIEPVDDMPARARRKS